MNYEQLYADFTSKLLPQIAEGFTITKDYFIELFGRYVQYLIVTDILGIVFSILVVFVSYRLVILGKKKHEENDIDFFAIILIICSVFSLVVALLGGLKSIGNLVKDIYIPEVRIYESLKGFNNK